MSLNTIRVQNLKPKKADYRIADGGGLYLLVRPSGSKLWRYDYRLTDSITGRTVRRRWVIPFDELKMAWLRTENGETPNDFVVPLSRQAVALLRELHEITGYSSFLFPGCGDAVVMSENTLNYALHGMGYKGVHCAHGFRASASTILNRQRTKEGRRRFETALAEIQQDRLDASTRAIYDRDDLMPERIELMQFWADKIDELREVSTAEREVRRVA